MSSVRRRGHNIRVSLDAVEADLLASLVSQVLELLADDPTSARDVDPDSDAPSLEQLLDASITPVETPQDPILARLLPDAYHDDPDASQEFRRLTDGDLRAAKRAGLGQILADLATGGSGRSTGDVRVELDTPAGATTWLYALTDVRLAFGTQIGVTEDMEDERATVEPDTERYAEIAIYDWLAWLQESIVHALTGD
jgi:Domain of unknown function (DUF2017)